MVGEFKAFLVKQGVLGLAVAVVIGGAVTKLVAAIVADLIMPIVGAAVPSGDWRKAVVQIGNIKFMVGDFAGVLLDFLIVALVVFFMVRKLVKETPPETEKA
jgi:large conductance mechanosensitive channel